MAKPKFHVKKIRGGVDIKNARKALGIFAVFLFSVVSVLAVKQALASTAVEPGASPTSSFSIPTVSDVNLPNQPGAIPTGTSAVLPQIQGANIRGIIVNQAGTTNETAEANPVQVYDALNVWGRLNVLNGIWNTRPDVIQAQLKVGTSVLVSLKRSDGYTKQYRIEFISSSTTGPTARIRVYDGPTVIDTKDMLTGTLWEITSTDPDIYIYLNLLTNASTSNALADLYISQSSITIPVPPFKVTINDDLNVQGSVSSTGALNAAGGLSTDGTISGTALDVNSGKLNVDANGNLTSLGAIATSGNVTAGGNVTGAAIGEFYTQTCDLNSTTNTSYSSTSFCMKRISSGYKFISAVCNSDDIRIACGGFQNGNLSKFKGSGFASDDITYNRKGCEAGSVQGTLANGANDTSNLFVYTFCFSPDG